MAYDVQSTYTAPARPYLSQRPPQSPQLSYRQPEQNGFNSISAAHDDYRRNGAKDPYNQPLANGAGRPHPEKDQKPHDGRDHGVTQTIASREKISETHRPGASSRRREPSRPGTRRPLVEVPLDDAMPVSQDNAFPIFPTKKAVAQKEAKTRDDQSRSQPPTSQDKRIRQQQERSQSRPPASQDRRVHQPEKSRSRPISNGRSRPPSPPPKDFDPSRPSTSNGRSRPASPSQRHSRPDVGNRADGHAIPRKQPPQTSPRQADGYRSPPPQPPPQIAQFPTFSPPYSQSSRPSTSDSAIARERPFLPPLDTHVPADAHVIESPQLSTVRARHHPAIIHPIATPNVHVPQDAHLSQISHTAHLSQGSESAHFSGISQSAHFSGISQAAHLSQASDSNEIFAPPQKPWTNRPSKHESLGDVYDDYYDREAEIEAEMPDFDTFNQNSNSHKRQTIEEHLSNVRLGNSAPAPQQQSHSQSQPMRQPQVQSHPQPQPGQTYQPASSKLRAPPSQPDARTGHATPVQDNIDDFDFGFGRQPLSDSPEVCFGQMSPPHSDRSPHYHQHQSPNSQLNAMRGDQVSAYGEPPSVPPHTLNYDGQGPTSNMRRPSDHHREFDHADHTAHPPQQNGFNYSDQGLMPLPQNQQRSFSYDDPRQEPPRASHQQRSHTYDDSNPQSRPPPDARFPVQPGGNLPYGPMSRGPMPTGPMPNRPPAGGPMLRDPPRRGPMPPGHIPPGSMPPGSFSGDMPRRGPMPQRPMPPGSVPPGPMNSGPRSNNPMIQNRRPPPGGPGYGPGIGVNAMPVQRHAFDNRAPSAPAIQGGFAPPPAERTGYGGPSMNHMTMDGRAPMQRHGPDNRAPSAPATQGGFAPPPPAAGHFEYERGPGIATMMTDGHQPMQRYAADHRPQPALNSQGGFSQPPPEQYGYRPGADGRSPVQRHMPGGRAAINPVMQGGFVQQPPPGQFDYRNEPDGRSPMQWNMPDYRSPSVPTTSAGGMRSPPPGEHRQGQSMNPAAMNGAPMMNNRAPMQRYAPDDRAPSAPATRGGFAPPPPPDHRFGAPLTQQRSAPQTSNPDSLPRHPIPVRPGLGGLTASQESKPAPVRHYAPEAQAPNQSQSQTQVVKARTSVEEKRKSLPVTYEELSALRSKVDANPNDNKTALLLVRKLVEAASVLASDNGRMDAKGTAKNRERYVLEAHKRVKKLVAAGYAEAMFYLADCYGSGELGLEMDPKQAFALYQSAAKAGHGAAAYRTAVCCEMGPEEGGGTKRDYVKAVQWYQRAAQLQDIPAMYKVGIILLRGLLDQQRNVGQAVVYLKRAAEHADSHNPHALHELARLHEAGNPDPAISQAVVPNEEHAQKLYMQAAKLGYKFSQFRLGQAYEYGSLGLPVDSRNSIAWYTKAAAQGEHNSELALSGWYLTGADGILGQSDTEAYLWARKAAVSEPPLAKAMYALGYYVENGIGCPPSVEEAKRWYGRAASYKFPKAIERLEEIRKGKASRPPPNAGRLARRDQKRDEAECVVM